MQIPPQEEWSLQLLNELQRAVPVLESSSFHLDEDDDDTGGQGDLVSHSAGSSSSQGWVSPRDANLNIGANANANSPLGGWGHRSTEDHEVSISTVEAFSDDAMALPMSTLTSGKRKTYPNKSTFQAHVCCVMDPAQVPRVLQTLQASPHYQSVRYWPYAYRIISPYDGQAHEGSCDGDDAGAGEKMLALLTRMKLENLLLIVSRWDTGPPNRLGCELFRCLNEGCKELLRELQQAVRASFPPEELLRADFASHTEGSIAGKKNAGLALTQGESSSSCTDDSETCNWEEADEAEYLAVGRLPGDSEEAPRHAGRLFDWRQLGSSSALGDPQRFRLVTHGVFGRTLRLRRAAQVAVLHLAAVQDETTPNGEVTMDRAAIIDAHIEVAQWSGLQTSRCPLNERTRNSRQYGTMSAQTATTSMSAEERIEQAAQMSMGRRKTMEANSLLGLNGQTCSSTEASEEIDEEEAIARQREVMSRLASEDLLRLGSRLREDRVGLEERLGSLSNASEVIRNVCVPFSESDSPLPRSSMMGNPIVKVSRRGTYLAADSENNMDRCRKSLRGSTAINPGCRRSLRVGRKSMLDDCRRSAGSGHLRQAGSLICSSR